MIYPCIHPSRYDPLLGSSYCTAMGWGAVEIQHKIFFRPARGLSVYLKQMTIVRWASARTDGDK